MQDFEVTAVGLPASTYSQPMTTVEYVVCAVKRRLEDHTRFRHPRRKIVSLGRLGALKLLVTERVVPE